MSDDRERQLRIQLMTTQAERLRQEIRTENRKFILQAIAAMAASVAAGAGALGLILHLMGRL